MMAVGSGRFSEARRWRNTAFGYAIAALIVGLANGMFLMYVGLDSLREGEDLVTGRDILHLVARGAKLEWMGVNGFALGAFLASVLSWVRTFAIRRRSRIVRSANVPLQRADDS